MDPNQQQLLLTSGGGKDYLYIDEVYNTKVYMGNGTERTITTGLDIAGEGGMIWFKNRDSSSQDNYLFDTTTLPTTNPDRSYYLSSNSSVERQPSAGQLKSFNSDGFTIFTDASVNGNGNKQIAWSFREAPGFFDIVQYDGNNDSARDVPHNLGCVPGMIITKCTSTGGDWWTYHKNLGRATGDWAKVLKLNQPDGQIDSQYCLGATTHQNASTFRVGNDNSMNTTGRSYVAYLFAGGESKAANAKSIVLNGSNQGLKTSSSSDYNFGTGDFTVEFWLKIDAIGNTMQTVDHRDPSGATSGMWCNYVDGNGVYNFWMDSDRIAGEKLTAGQWYHIANVRNSGVTTLYINGTSQGTWNDTQNYSNTRIVFGVHGPNESSFPVDGDYSNIRIVKGTAVYTESFNPPTAPLTNITNTKFLGANSSTATGTTVGTAIAINAPSVESNGLSPFDDPASFNFGEGEDSQVVKCGSYIGNTSIAPVIYLGWEPQYIMIKSKVGNNNWAVFNNVSGINWSQDEKYLYPNLSNSEYTAERMKLFPKGFYVDTSAGALINTASEEYVYMAIRRSDAFVGKPAKVGTDVFDMAYGTDTSAASGLPSFASTFKVDMRLQKEYNGGQSWYIGTRMRDHRQLHTNTNDSEVTGTYTDFEHSLGEGNNWNSNRIGYMWKRHAGFDVVCYLGDSTNSRTIPHNLNQIPEMIWIKNTVHNNTVWVAGHMGLNGGSNPWDYWIRISGGTEKEALDGGSMWGGVAPTKTHFHIGGMTEVNQTQSASGMVAYLFSSVTGISKCGWYNGDDSTDGSKVITTGFQPRWIMIKCVTNNGENWNVVDSLRGLTAAGGGNEKPLKLNSSASQGNVDVVDVSPSGFALRAATGDYNAINQRYIYYAHA